MKSCKVHNRNPYLYSYNIIMLSYIDVVDIIKNNIYECLIDLIKL